MLSSKLAQAGGWWGAAPLCLQTYCSHGKGGGAKRLILQGGFQKRLKTAGGGGGVGRRHPPRICKHNARMVCYYPAATVLTAVIVIFIFMHIFIPIISMRM